MTKDVLVSISGRHIDIMNDPALLPKIREAWEKEVT